MDGVGLIQDLGIVLLAAGVVGVICRRIGLSVIVGYLVAGIIVGPYTPPFSLVLDLDRIQTLSQVGLVFLMFGIGLGLSISKMSRLGFSTVVATALGAFLMLGLTKILGSAAGWPEKQTLFVAAMFMVSSSAVIAKIVGELNLTHERAAQQALGITVLEDVVAVTMLTILAATTHGGDANVGSLLTGLSAFVVLLGAVGLLMVPRLMRRLEARANPELQTIIVAGLLFMLSLAALKAGYSLALGAFLLGAIVAEIPQRTSVEKSFAGMRDVFSSVFFVSIGMLIDVSLLKNVWPWVIGLGVFVLVARAVALSTALIACGSPVRDARRAGLLLGPLGEFSFIIAQLGVGSAVLSPEYYPIAVGTSILTVLVVPVINRFAEPILDFLDRAEPGWMRRAVVAYQFWLAQLQRTPTTSGAWRLIRSRIPQLVLELLLVTGVMISSRQLLAMLMPHSELLGITPRTLGYIFWGAITVVALIPLVAIWRNIAAVSLIYAESVATTRLPVPLVHNILRAVAGIFLAFWLYAIIPIEQIGGWGWVVVGLFAVLVVAVYSRKLIYWHSGWQSSVRSVLAEGAPSGRSLRDQDLSKKGIDEWNVKLADLVVPDSAAFGGNSLEQLSIPARFGCIVLEIERNGIVITTIRPDVRVYPGDTLLLMGEAAQVKAAIAALSNQIVARDDEEDMSGSILETSVVPEVVWSGRTLAELNIGKLTGARIVGIHREGQRVIAPSGQEQLRAGDNVLVAGTMAEISEFRRWLHSPTPAGA